jgi:type VI secretion system protein VasD
MLRHFAFLPILIAVITSAQLHAYEAVKTQADGIACMSGSKTRDDIKLESLLNATSLAKKIASEYTQTSLAQRQNYNKATVDVIDVIAEKWFTDAKGDSCFMISITAAVTPEQPVSSVMSRGLNAATRGVSPTGPIDVLITGKPDLNPDVDGKPLSIELRVIQLSSQEGFKMAKMEDLIKSGEKVIGYVSKDSKTISPGSSDSLSLDIKSNARYLGIAAYFRQPEGEGWKKVIPLSAPKNKKIDKVNISVSSKSTLAASVSTIDLPVEEKPIDIAKTDEIEDELPPIKPQKMTPKPSSKYKPPAVETPTEKPLSYDAPVENPKTQPMTSASLNCPIDASFSTSRVIRTDRTTYYDNDKVKMYITPKMDCYAIIYYTDVQGNTLQLLPNQYRQDNFLKAGTSQELPLASDKFELVVKPPYGCEKITLHCSSSTLKNNDLSLRPLQSGPYQVNSDLSKRDYVTSMRGIEIAPKNAPECRQKMDQTRALSIVPKDYQTTLYKPSNYIGCNQVSAYQQYDTYILTKPRLYSQ